MSNVDPRIAVGDYVIGDCIGRGGFGFVYKAFDKKTGKTVAVKKIKTCGKPGSEEAVRREIHLLKSLQHPNILEYLSSETHSGFLYIFLEYMENGSLETLCKNFGTLPESLIAVYMTQVLEGLVYLHHEGVIHRDIKGANLLTTKEGVLKLADFGVASELADIDPEAVAGTPLWMAPEIIEMRGASTASDIWSVGCTIIELSTGSPPYAGLVRENALIRIVQDPHPPLPDTISRRLRHFLSLCFQKDPALRSSARRLLQHAWIQAHRTAATINTSTSSATSTAPTHNHSGGATSHTRVPPSATKRPAPLTTHRPDSVLFEDAVATIRSHKQLVNRAVERSVRASGDPSSPGKQQHSPITGQPQSSLSVPSSSASSSVARGGVPPSLNVASTDDLNVDADQLIVYYATRGRTRDYSPAAAARRQANARADLRARAKGGVPPSAVAAVVSPPAASSLSPIAAQALTNRTSQQHHQQQGMAQSPSRRLVPDKEEDPNEGLVGDLDVSVLSTGTPSLSYDHTHAQSKPTHRTPQQQKSAPPSHQIHHHPKQQQQQQQSIRQPQPSVHSHPRPPSLQHQPHPSVSSSRSRLSIQSLDRFCDNDEDDFSNSFAELPDHFNFAPTASPIAVMPGNRPISTFDSVSSTTDKHASGSHGSSSGSHSPRVSVHKAAQMAAQASPSRLSSQQFEKVRADLAGNLAADFAIVDDADDVSNERDEDGAMRLHRQLAEQKRNRRRVPTQGSGGSPRTTSGRTPTISSTDQRGNNSSGRNSSTTSSASGNSAHFRVPLDESNEDESTFQVSEVARGRVVEQMMTALKQVKAAILCGRSAVEEEDGEGKQQCVSSATKSCLALAAMLADLPDAKCDFFARCRGIQFVALLEHATVDAPLTEAVLRLLNELVHNNAPILETLCTLGLLSRVAALCHRCAQPSSDSATLSRVAVELARLLHHACLGPPVVARLALATDLFVSLRDLLCSSPDDDATSMELVRLVSETVWSMFEQGCARVLTLHDGKAPSTLSLLTLCKDDMCEALVNCPRLLETLMHAIGRAATHCDWHTTSTLIQLSKSLSMSTSLIKVALSTRASLDGLLRALTSVVSSVDGSHLTGLLRTLTNLAWDADAVNAMERAQVHTAERLVGLLQHLVTQPLPRDASKARSGGRSREMQVQLLNTLYFYTRVSRDRQLEVVRVADAVPLLASFVCTLRKTGGAAGLATLSGSGDSGGSLTVAPQAQFAMSILCDAVMAGSEARAILLRCGLVDVFVSLMDQTAWQVQVLEALGSWLAEERSDMQSDRRGSDESAAVESVLYAQREVFIEHVVRLVSLTTRPLQQEEEEETKKSGTVTSRSLPEIERILLALARLLSSGTRLALALALSANEQPLLNESLAAPLLHPRLHLKPSARIALLRLIEALHRQSLPPLLRTALAHTSTADPSVLVRRFALRLVPEQ